MKDALKFVSWLLVGFYSDPASCRGFLWDQDLHLSLGCVAQQIEIPCFYVWLSFRCNLPSIDEIFCAWEVVFFFFFSCLRIASEDWEQHSAEIDIRLNFTIQNQRRNVQLAIWTSVSSLPCLCMSTSASSLPLVLMINDCDSVDVQY